MVAEKKLFIILLAVILNVAAQEGTTDSPEDEVTGRQGANSPETTSVDPTLSTTSSPSPSTTKASTTTSEPEFGSCWSCLFDIAEELCSYLTDWNPFISDQGVNIFSIFNQGSNNRTNLNKRPQRNPNKEKNPKRYVQIHPRGVSPSNDEEGAFLDLLHEFYLKSRERFVSEYPSVSLSADLDNLYKRPNELALVASDVLKVPAKDLTAAFERLMSKDTGRRLWQALDNRQQAGRENGKKTVSGLSPTSISYFFKELLGSMNGISTGLSEILSILLQNQTATALN